jgi:hypothetical protein
MDTRTLTGILVIGTFMVLALIAERSAQANDWHVGVNMRTDPGTRQARLDAGVRLSRFDITAVVDPMGFVDGQFDLDLVASVRLPARLQRFSLFAGHRTTVFNLEYGRPLHEKLLVGLSVQLPTLVQWKWLRAQAGVELAANYLRHGGGMPHQTIDFRSGRHFIDLVNASFYLRFEYTSPL